MIREKQENTGLAIRLIGCIARTDRQSQVQFFEHLLSLFDVPTMNRLVEFLDDYEKEMSNKKLTCEQCQQAFGRSTFVSPRGIAHPWCLNCRTSDPEGAKRAYDRARRQRASKKA
jgi:hypothetical protein